MNLKPTKKPINPSFSSGPCPKRPGWTHHILKEALIGRSHRSPEGKKILNQAILLTKEILEIPDDFRVGIVPGSDTGAIEMAMWNLLGARPVDVLAWESFGGEWVQDIVESLQLESVSVHESGYGQLPDLSKVSFKSDVVFVWNGTTSGVRLINADWIPVDREGLTLCDATSAAFAMDLPWEKLDVTTFSWQKVLGGEAAHGVIVMSPRAAERLQDYTPRWPIPKLLRLAKDKVINESLFDGATINTPSMLCVHDYLDALNWAKDMGGVRELWRKSSDNLQLVEEWVLQNEWIDFLAEEPKNRSNTSICLKFVSQWFTAMSDKEQRKTVKEFCNILSNEHVAYDIEGYRNAPPGLRLWGGSTVESSDIILLLPWLEWAYAKIKG